MATSRWSLRNIYLYLVCLITLIMVIFSVVNLVRSTVELLYPDPYYVSYVREPEPAKDGRSQEDIDRDRELSRQSAVRQAVLSLVGSVAMLAVAGPLYVYHWRKIESELPDERKDATPTA